MTTSPKYTFSIDGSSLPFCSASACSAKAGDDVEAAVVAAATAAALAELKKDLRLRTSAVLAVFPAVKP